MRAQLTLIGTQSYESVYQKTAWYLLLFNYYVRFCNLELERPCDFYEGWEKCKGTCQYHVWYKVQQSWWQDLRNVSVKRVRTFFKVENRFLNNTSVSRTVECRFKMMCLSRRRVAKITLESVENNFRISSMKVVANPCCGIFRCHFVLSYFLSMVT